MEHDFTRESLSDIPRNQITAEMCLKAVLKDGSNYQFVPKEFRTDSLLDKAVRSCPFIIATLSSNELTEDVCRKALLSSESIKSGSYELLHYIPFENTLKNGITMFHKLGTSMENICGQLNPNFLNEEIIRHICKDSLSNIKLIPNGYITPEMYFKLNKLDSSYSLYTPKNIQNSSLFKLDEKLLKEGYKMNADSVIKLHYGKKVMLGEGVRGAPFKVINYNKGLDKIETSVFSLDNSIKKRQSRGYKQSY